MLFHSVRRADADLWSYVAVREMAVRTNLALQLTVLLVAVGLAVSPQGNGRLWAWIGLLLLSALLAAYLRFRVTTGRTDAIRPEVLFFFSLGGGVHRGGALLFVIDNSRPLMFLVVATAMITTMSAAFFAIAQQRGAVVGLAALGVSAGVSGLASAQYGLGATVIAVAVVGTSLVVTVERLTRALLAESERRIEDARVDGLTGLLTRDAFQHRVAQLPPDQGSAVLIVDVDDFKVINDTFGHGVGDGVLQHVSACLATQSDGVVARLGGDEFVVLSSRGPDRSDYVALGDALLEAVVTPAEVAELLVDVTVSVGIAFVGDGPDALTLAMHQADLALYRAKQCGGNLTEMFDPDERGQIGVNRTRQRAVRAALDAGDITHFLQPVIHAPTGTIRSVELLARFTTVTGEVLHAAEFLDTGLHTRAISEIDRLALDQVARLAADSRWHGLDFAINIEPLQLRDAISHCAALEIPFDRLIIEITEQGLIHSYDAARNSIAAAHAIGARFVLDDFGTGYSSLQRLVELPLSGIKLDRIFCAEIATSPRREAVVRSTALLATDLGLEVTAEGVETEADARQLERLGIDLHQGYLYARAQPAREIQALLPA